jgi:hypothetical protein
MKCDKCRIDIPEGDQRDHFGETLCEDCYMMALSPMKTCDPWAVYSAKSFDEHRGAASTLLNPIQKQIMAALEQSGGMEPQDLLNRLEGKLSMEELQREFSSLRHMEKARAEKRSEKIFWRTW